MMTTSLLSILRSKLNRTNRQDEEAVAVVSKKFASHFRRQNTSESAMNSVKCNTLLLRMQFKNVVEMPRRIIKGGYRRCCWGVKATVRSKGASVAIITSANNNFLGSLGIWTL